MEAIANRPVTDLLLSEAEIVALTTYARPAEQLVELHRQGFYRARRNRLGQVVVERAHYDAVCRSARGAANDETSAPRPKLRSPRRSK